MKEREAILKMAEAELGYTESPKGSNTTKYGEWYGMNHVAWCAIFVSWCFFMAGSPLGRIQTVKGFHGCQAAINYFRKAKLLTIDPAPGDIVFFDWNDDSHSDHVGLFLRWVIKGQTFETYEGNTSAGNQSNGGQVQHRTRSIHEVACFVNPLNLPFA
jgi:cell wall-associated NlpC family hydrolase